MSKSEEIVLCTFLFAVAATYIWSFGILVDLLLEKLGWTKKPTGKLRIRIRKTVLGLGAFGLLCFAYALFVEPYWLEVKHVRVKSKKLQPGAQPITIVQISDLHSEQPARLEDKIATEIGAVKPDLIVFTGDALNSPEGLPIFRRCISQLPKIAPTVVVRGNWDSWYWNKLDLFDGTGVQTLKDGPLNFDIKGTKVWVGGADVGDESKVLDLLKSAPPDALRVFLYHYPHLVLDIAGQTDLYFCGHLHGGQVAMPFYGALITLSPTGKLYESGLYHVKETMLYVNRGIGMEGGRVPRFRFCARPEITVLVIEPE